MGTTDADLVPILRRIFEVNGLEIKGDMVVARRLLGEGVIRNLKIFTLERFVQLFGDGKYFIEGFDVTVKGLDPEPFYINYICIEAEYEDKNWKVEVRTDEEEIFYSEASQLDTRKDNLSDVCIDGLRLFTSLLQMAGGLKQLFSS